MASFDELSAHIGDGKNKVDEAVSAVTTAKSGADELTATFQSLNADGQAAATSAISEQLEQAINALSAVKSQLEGSQQSTDAARNGLSVQAPSPPTAPNVSTVDRPPGIPGFSERRPVPECVEAIKKEGWPKNAKGRISARGFLYDEKGRPVNTEVFKPHRRGEAPPCTDLKAPWSSDPDYTTTWHTERDAAKAMRENSLAKGVLYQNIQTCGKESADPQRCDANLEKILPADSELFVWSIHEDGSRARRRYQGNGEAING